MKKILIVKANYYNLISKKLSQESINLLRNKTKVSVIEVPGIFEIPVVISRNYNKFDGFVALGCVIKGQTPHFDLICNATFNALMSLSTNFKKPIGNGIITALNAKQAHERCGIKKSKKLNKGFEAANAVLSILKNGPKKV